MKFLLDVEFAKGEPTFVGNLIIEYAPGLWNGLVNILVYLVIDQLSVLRKYIEYVSNQRFITRLSIFFLTLNMIIIPILSISVDADVLNVTRNIFTWKRYNQGFLFPSTGIQSLTVSNILHYYYVAKRVSRIFERYR